VFSSPYPSTVAVPCAISAILFPTFYLFFRICVWFVATWLFLWVFRSVLLSIAAYPLLLPLRGFLSLVSFFSYLYPIRFFSGPLHRPHWYPCLFPCPSPLAKRRASLCVHFFAPLVSCSTDGSSILFFWENKEFRTQLALPSFPFYVLQHPILHLPLSFFCLSLRPAFSRKACPASLFFQIRVQSPPLTRPAFIACPPFFDG